MRNEGYRLFVESVQNQEIEDPMPYDAIIRRERSGEIAGFVRDNFIVETVDKNGDGRIIRVPANISYSKHEEQWFKHFYDYYENVDQTAQQSFGSYYAVYDEKSGISFLAIPLSGFLLVFVTGSTSGREASFFIIFCVSSNSLACLSLSFF